ncbi:alpha/beta-hydrolase [Xylaria telfairii]|nr:alpha/beta-hydrolase [Xylaria telfairii]
METAASFQLACGREISYTLTMPNAPFPVVILSQPHCFSLDVWDDVVAHLGRLSVRVLRYNPPGHGNSGVPANLSETTFESLADDVHALLSHLGIKNLYAWVGSGFGAATAAVFAARYPDFVWKLVLCDAIIRSPVNWGTQDFFKTRVIAARKAGSLEPDINEAMNRYFGSAWLSSQPLSAHVGMAMRSTSLDGFETCCAALDSPSFDLGPLAAKIGSNIGLALFLHGDRNYDHFMDDLRDGIIRGQRIRTLRSGKGPTPSVPIQMIQGGGRVSFVDGFDHFMNTLMNFLTA